MTDQHPTPLAGVFIDPAQREAALQEARSLPQIVLSPLSISDVELLGNGAYTPLTGFLNKADYASVVDTMHLTNGSVWSIPITLPVDREFADSIKDGQRVALAEPDGHILAIATVEEKFDYDKQREAREVFRTEEEKHPGVARLYQQGDVLLDNYYPANRVALSVFPAAMRYAGPREAIFHALCRKNYGCTHFIVGRDHAGVGNYYGTYDAQLIFDEFQPGELGITPLMFEHTFYCQKCEAIVSSRTCPHDKSQHLIFSGTEVRRRLRAGEPLPHEFTRPEVGQVLIDGLRENGQ
ncbi:MAG: hypothetical protein HY870_24370 [Chloroflexi bacterium]|nr:hypothetical protein [Chloroflexota bacterium]